MPRSKRRATRLDVVPVHRVAEQVRGDVFATKLRRKCRPLVDHAADGDMPAAEILMRNMVEIAVREWIVQRPVLAKRLPVIAALHAVQHDVPAKIGAVQQLACGIEIEAPRITAALAEQLELPRD